MSSPAYDAVRFHSPDMETLATTNRLPHRHQSGTTCFYTWRMADSIPVELFERWESERVRWIDEHPEPWTPALEREYHELFSTRIERYLDRGHGSCVLRQPWAAGIVAEALAFFEGSRIYQQAWVIMPNHVHVLCSLIEPFTVADMVHSWKSFTSKKINQHLGTAGTFWQKDYFDRLVRDWKHFENCVRYIRRNPVMAKLSPEEYQLYTAPWINERMEW